jgi:muconolactone delta-isomerase
MKYQVILNFELTEEFMQLVPKHRVVINELINSGIIESYTVSMESQRSWIIFNATSKEEVEVHLKLSPLFSYWEVEIEEIFVYDSMMMRFPETSLN